MCYETGAAVSRLLEHLTNRLSRRELALVNQAVEHARQAHCGQTRDDGSPYILHPIRTALIIAEELGIDDPACIFAALLHDVLEESNSLSQTAISQAYGTTVGRVVLNLTKPSGELRTRDAVNRVYFSRLSQSDVRTRTVKLADRLDNLRDLNNCPDSAKRTRIVAETRSFYVPLIQSLQDATIREILTSAFQRALDTLKH